MPLFTPEEIERQSREQTAMRKHNLGEEAKATKKKMMGKALTPNPLDMLSPEDRALLIQHLEADEGEDRRQMELYANDARSFEIRRWRERRDAERLKEREASALFREQMAARSNRRHEDRLRNDQNLGTYWAERETKAWGDRQRQK